MNRAKKQCSMLERAQEYLNYRRALGYRLQSDGEKLLQFARWRMIWVIAVRSRSRWPCNGQRFLPRLREAITHND